MTERRDLDVAPGVFRDLLGLSTHRRHQPQQLVRREISQLDRLSHLSWYNVRGVGHHLLASHSADMASLFASNDLVDSDDEM
jgi:hypothetical protein